MNDLLSFTCVDCLSWPRLSSLVNRVITGGTISGQSVVTARTGVSTDQRANKYFTSVDWSAVEWRISDQMY